LPSIKGSEHVQHHFAVRHTWLVRGMRVLTPAHSRSWVADRSVGLGVIPAGVQVGAGWRAGGAGRGEPDQIPATGVLDIRQHAEYIAGHLLERAGHHDLRVLVGGAEDWTNATGQHLEEGA
jgi:hypothetical protein